MTVIATDSYRCHGDGGMVQRPGIDALIVLKPILLDPVVQVVRTRGTANNVRTRSLSSESLGRSL